MVEAAFETFLVLADENLGVGGKLGTSGRRNFGNVGGVGARGGVVHSEGMKK